METKLQKAERIVRVIIWGILAVTFTAVVFTLIPFASFIVAVGIGLLINAGFYLPQGIVKYWGKGSTQGKFSKILWAIGVAVVLAWAVALIIVGITYWSLHITL